MNPIRTSKLLYVGLLFALVACQAKAAPPAPTLASPTAAPTTVQSTTAAPTVVPAQALTTFSPQEFDLPITFRYGPEWKIDLEVPSFVSFTYKDFDGYFAFIDPKTIKIAGPAAPYAAISFPDAFVSWIQSHGLFHVVKTQPVVVGGLPGTQIDADPTPACGADLNWLLAGPGGWGCAVGGHYRFIYLDNVNGARLFIMSEGGLSADQFALKGDAAQKLLDSVSFAKPSAAVPSAAPQLIEHKLPTAASEPGGIVAGPDGALWFVETAANKIGRISTAGAVTEYAVPTAGAIDADQGFLAVGPDGALWFNEDLVNQIGRITTAGQVTEYKLPAELKPTQDDAPIRAIVAGPDGGLWVTSPGANAIVKLTLDGKIAAKYALPKTSSNPVGMVPGPDGALWFVEASANQIGRVTLAGQLSEYALPDGSKPLRLTVGPDKAFWFTMVSSSKVGRISADGKVTEFDAAGMGPVGIAAGADGAIWFTGYNSSEIGRLTTDGVLTKIKVLTLASVPYHIAAGPDGNLWFTEQQGNQIGQIELTAP